MWDLMEVHACFDGEGWVWNESFHHKDVFVERNLLARMSDVLPSGLSEQM